MRLAPIVFLTLLAAGCATPDAPGPATPPPGASQSLPPVREAALDWIEDQFGAAVGVNYGEADLDGDGTMEALVLVDGPDVCGSGGCTFVALRRASSGMQVLARTSVTRAPLGVLDTSTGAMRDLWVTVGGGGLERGYRKLAWQGTAYPANPTVAPAEPIDTMGQTIIADQPARTLEEARQGPVE